MKTLDSLPGRDWVFTWLIPLTTSVEGGKPDGAETLTWQELGASLREWLGTVPDDAHDRHGVRLVSEFLDHLEREERLAFTERLEKDDARVLGTYEIARGRLNELLRQAKLLLEQEWGCDEDREYWPGRQSLPLPGFHVVLRRGRQNAESPWPEHCYFEWHVRGDDARERPDGSWILGAGATFEAADAPDEAEFTEWFEDIRGVGFEYGQGGAKREHSYIFRYLTLEGLVEHCDGKDVGAQARQLADWVIAALDALNDFGPPRRYTGASLR